MNETILLARQIAADTIPVLYSTGIVANILSIIVFSRNKFKNTIFETYFRLMSLTDLISLAYPINSFFQFRYGIETYPLSVFFCFYLDFFIFVFPATSAWILSIISFDRMINIVFPSKLTKFKKNKIFQYFCCSLALINSMLAYGPIFYYREFNSYSNFDNQTNQTTSYNLCELKEGAGSILWTDLFYGSVVPALIMLILNVATITTLFRSRKKSSTGISKRDVRFAFTSFALIIFFFVLVVLSQLYLLLSAYGFFKSDEQITFWQTLTCLAYTIYFSLIFFVNLIVNSMFREEFFKMINEIKSRF
jgi:hypothetical protein